MSEDSTLYVTASPDRQTAGEYLVSRLFTDAIFNRDVRSVMNLVSRIDGAIVKDSDWDAYDTLFGEAIRELFDQTEPERLKVYPEDTVLTALAKALYDIAVEDIYSAAKRNGKSRPSTDLKNDRDAAMRMILDRAGGKRSAQPIKQAVLDILPAEWIPQLPKSTSEV
jgi:hypothetical protein